MTQIPRVAKMIRRSFYYLFRAGFQDWHIRKVINLSNFLKLFFIYAFSVAWVISFDIQYSQNFWYKAVEGNFSDKRFSFYGVSGRIGEGALYDRIQATADKLGFDYTACKFSGPLSDFWFTAHFYYVATSMVNYLLKPQFNLAITHHVNILPAGYNITYLNMPLDSLFDYNGEFLKPWQHLYKYDLYVDLYSLVNCKNELLENLIKKSGINKPVVPLYLAQNAEEYHELNMDMALITGTLWGCNRGSVRVSQALKRLADEGLLVGIGIKDYLGFLGNAYLGRMEDFGRTVEAIPRLQRKYGIALIIHNQAHMLDGIPTSRIAEAISAGALVISDRNLFSVKFFGDNILYFDAFADRDQLYLQIKNHIEWARNNPEAARVKTRNAYKIFMDNFTMEKQLLKLFLAANNRA